MLPISKCGPDADKWLVVFSVFRETAVIFTLTPYSNHYDSRRQKKQKKKPAQLLTAVY